MSNDAASNDAVSKSGEPKLHSVNVGAVREVKYQGRTIRTGIFKTPTEEPQTVEGVHLGADLQADTEAHGGFDKALYAYAAEDYAWWAGEVDRAFEPGLFGENLTTVGVDVSGANVGDRWHVGSVVLEVSEPRVPCFKLGIAVGVPRFQQHFSKADRPGAYLRIVEPGLLRFGDTVEIEHTSEPTVSVAAISAMYQRRGGDPADLVDVPGLSAAWRAWARGAAVTDS